MDSFLTCTGPSYAMRFIDARNQAWVAGFGTLQRPRKH